MPVEDEPGPVEIGRVAEMNRPRELDDPVARALVLASDGWTRRAEIRSQRVLDNPAFFERFQ
jgi:hypothetical protein